MQRGSAASGPTPCGDAAKGDILFLRKRISPLHPQEKGRGESPLDPRHWQFVARITAHAAQSGVVYMASPWIFCKSSRLATAPYYREARVTFARRQTACRMRHCCARRIVETGGRRELGCTSTRWAERHPQGVCRIRKASEPPTAAQQRIVGAEANRFAMLTRLRRARGTFTSETSELFKPETANPRPFSGGSKGGILFCEREYPLCPCRPQAAYPSHLRETDSFLYI